MSKAITDFYEKSLMFSREISKELYNRVNEDSEISSLEPNQFGYIMRRSFEMKPKNDGSDENFRLEFRIANGIILEFTMREENEFRVLVNNSLKLSVTNSGLGSNITAASFCITFETDDIRRKFSNGVIDTKMVDPIYGNRHQADYFEEFIFKENHRDGNIIKGDLDQTAVDENFDDFWEIMQFTKDEYGISDHRIFFKSLFLKVENILDRKCNKLKVEI